MNENRMTPYRFYLVQFLVVALLIAANSFSNAVASSPVGSANAQDTLKKLYDELITTLDKRKADILKNPELLNQLSEELVVPHIDFVRMSKTVLGKYWRELSVQDQQRYIDFMRTKISSAMIKLYDPEKSFDLRFVGSRDSPDGKKSVVQTRWQAGENAQVYAVDYRLLASDKGWLVYDVSVDGISVLQSYKTAVADEIEAGSLAQYMASLNKQDLEKTAELSTR